MFGIDDVVLVLVAASLVNLVVEIGVEAVAAWAVPDAPPIADAASEPIRYELTEASVQLDQMTSLSLNANGLKAMAGDAVIWSEQMIGSLGSSLGLL